MVGMMDRALPSSSPLELTACAGLPQAPGFRLSSCEAAVWKNHPLALAVVFLWSLHLPGFTPFLSSEFVYCVFLLQLCVFS